MSKKITPCEKLGYKAGDKFEVIEDSVYFKKGEIVSLRAADNSSCPFFINEKVVRDGYRKGCAMYLSSVRKISKLKPAKQSLADAINQNGGWVEGGDWHKSGELPPVGEVCEAYIDYPPQWIETEIVAHKDGFAIGWCKSVMKGCYGDKAHEFRPLRSEREKAIDEMMAIASTEWGSLEDVCGVLYMAGYRKEIK